MVSFGGLDKHTETSDVFLVVYFCVFEAMDYLSIILHVLFGSMREQHNNVQYPHKYSVIATSLCGLCVAQLGKNKATEVESVKIASVSCLSFLSHAFNFFPPSPYSCVLASSSPTSILPPFFRWKSIPLPPFPALLPPHIWFPLHSLVLSLSIRMGVGWVRSWRQNS